MRICVLTSLYPSAPLPFEGVFAERRWSEMAARGHAIRVVQPTPRAPLGALGAGLGQRLGRQEWRDAARKPARELRAAIEIERPRYLHVPGLSLRNAHAFARAGVRTILAHGRPDAVVCDYAWPAAAAAPLLATSAVPVLISGRGSDVLQVAGVPALAAELSRCLRAAGHWIGVSRDLVHCMDRLGESPGRGVLVPNGVDLELFRVQDRGAAREQLGLAIESSLVLVVGHLIERKDPSLALRAFLAGAPAHALLAFVGRGPLEARVRELARDCGQSERVRFAGELEPRQLARWYAACDALLLTSSREGRPNVVLEALACGRAVVATDAGGTAELLAGLPDAVDSDRDPAAIGARLARALARPAPPEELRARVQGLSWGASSIKLEGCIANLLKAHSRP